MQELRFAALLQESQQPARHAESAGEPRAGGGDQSAAHEENHDEQCKADRHADDDVLAFAPVESRLRDAHRERQVLLLLLADFKFLERVFDLLAAHLRATARGGGNARGRLGAHHARLAFLGMPFARQDRIDEDPDQPACGERHQEEQRERLDRHARLSL